ncbi:MAG: glycosyltransferase involved in cell wall biosynthesis [Flavobacteriaceae bacterium]|jgi:glycosyltransferase involved in cell wall biosynthesis
MVNNNCDISVLIPCFNNANSIKKLVKEICTLLENNRINYEIILIDDCSTDNSFDIIKNISRENKYIKGLKHVQNYGQVPTFITGFKYAKAKCCVLISADLQEPPSLILKMYEEWKMGNDLVLALRKNRKDSNFSKIVSNLLFATLSVFYKKLPRRAFDYGLLDRKIYDSLKLCNPYLCFLQVAVLKESKKHKYVYYTRERSANKKTSWKLINKIGYALSALYEIDNRILLKSYLFNLAIIIKCVCMKVNILDLFLLLISIFLVLSFVVLTLNASKKIPALDEVVC